MKINESGMGLILISDIHYTTPYLRETSICTKSAHSEASTTTPSSGRQKYAKVMDADVEVDTDTATDVDVQTDLDIELQEIESGGVGVGFSGGHGQIPPATLAPTLARYPRLHSPAARSRDRDGLSHLDDQANMDLDLDLDEGEGEGGGWSVCRVLWALLTLPKNVAAFFKRHPLTLVQVLIWQLYYLVGILYYRSVEGWTTQQCIYFITVTFSTVGYGQYGPTTDDSRVFTAFYCVFGIVCVLTSINRAASRWLIRLQVRVFVFVCLSLSLSLSLSCLSSGVFHALALA